MILITPQTAQCVLCMFRFIAKCKNKNDQSEKSSPPTDYYEALTKVVKVLQPHEFRDVIENIRKLEGRRANASISLRNFRKFSYDDNFPLLLTKSSKFVQSYVQLCH